MLNSLKESFSEPSGTKAAIRLAMKSPRGMRVTWIVVEGEEDVTVYSKFMQPDATAVKTSEGADGKAGYANVELIVTEIKAEVPVAHIFGIRDADYSRFKSGYTAPENIFLTDQRDLEMLLGAGSVRSALSEWIPEFATAWETCRPICRYFGYLRICNSFLNLNCNFHAHLKTTQFWEFSRHALVVNWKDECTRKFLSLVNRQCTVEELRSFIEDNRLEQMDFLDVCRGHDLVALLALALVKKEYSAANILQKMIQTYSLDDFRQTRLYADIAQWQENEGVEALL